MKKMFIPVLALLFLLLATTCTSFLRLRNTGFPRLNLGDDVVTAGVRASTYGITPFPGPDGWKKAITTMSGYYRNSSQCAVWIIGEIWGDSTCHLFFPSKTSLKDVSFDGQDKYESYLEQFDKTRIKVYLQVEPACADVSALIDLVLDRYSHHPCVAGFGVDVEWLHTKESPVTGTKVSDEMAAEWEARVKAHDPAYRLFLKHWDADWMPALYRGDIIFVDDSQGFSGLQAMSREFIFSWAARFYPNPVFFQVGYPRDRSWWSACANPVQEIGAELSTSVLQECGIIWVDFSLDEVLPVN
jgi:hypothetical protein